MQDEAEMFLELNKSVSRLKALSTMPAILEEAGRRRGLEHTLDAILNLAQKSTFDESTSLDDSLRVVRPIHQRQRRQTNGTMKRDSSSRSSGCSLKLLFCGRSDNDREDEDEVTHKVVYPGATKSSKIRQNPSQAVTSVKSSKAVGNRSRQGSRDREAPSASGVEGLRKSRPKHRNGGDLSEGTGWTSKSSNSNSKKGMLLNLERTNDDDVSSLSSFHFPRRDAAYDPNTVVSSHASGSIHDPNPCLFGAGDGMLGNYRGYRHTIKTTTPQQHHDSQFSSFMDVLLCSKSPLDRHRKLPDDESFFEADEDIAIKIVGVHADEEPMAKRHPRKVHADHGKSLSTGLPARASNYNNISRMEAEHKPRHLIDRSKSDKATVYIYNQSTKSQRY